MLAWPLASVAIVPAGQACACMLVAGARPACHDTWRGPELQLRPRQDTAARRELPERAAVPRSVPERAATCRVRPDRATSRRVVPERLAAGRVPLFRVAASRRGEVPRAAVWRALGLRFAASRRGAVLRAAEGRVAVRVARASLRVVAARADWVAAVRACACSVRLRASASGPVQKAPHSTRRATQMVRIVISLSLHFFIFRGLS